MSITEELRRVAAKTECANGRCEKLYRGDLDHIADRIDGQVGREYIELPKDADGLPIRVGDVMESIVHPPTHREVTGVGIECFYAWEVGCGRYSQFGANCYRHHHHEPTVEDVLREFVERWHDTHHDDIPALFAEYAAKLRLAGEDA